MTKFLVSSIVLLLLFFSTSSLALNVTSVKPSYIKGEGLFLAGQCVPGSAVKVSGRVGLARLFDETVSCTQGGELVYNYSTSCLDPSGTLSVMVSSGGEEASLEFALNKSPECSYYLLSILSPASGVKHLRTEALTVSAKLAESGEPVDDAKVVFYSPSGEMLELAGQGDGIYLIDYFIPSNAALGDIDLHVLAEKDSQQGIVGGESFVTLPIAKVPIVLTIIKPDISNFDLEEEIPIETELSYSTGIKVEDAVVEFEVNGSKGLLKRDASKRNVFTGSYVSREKDLGAAAVKLSAFDPSGNEGQAQANVVVSAEPATIFLRQYLGVAVAAVLFIALFGYIALRKGSMFMSKKALEEELANTGKELEKLHIDYYDTMTVSKSFYRKRLGELQAREKEVKKALEAKK